MTVIKNPPLRFAGNPVIYFKADGGEPISLGKPLRVEMHDLEGNLTCLMTRDGDKLVQVPVLKTHERVQ